MQIKMIISGWKELSKEQIKEIILYRIYNISSVYKQNTFKYINNNLLKGITAEELLKDTELSTAVKNNIYG